MTTQQFVEVTIQLSVDVFDALQTISTDFLPISIMKTVTEAAKLAVAEEDQAYYKINIKTFDRTVSLWVRNDWEPKDIWGNLRKTHGIDREGRKFAIRGEEFEEYQTVGSTELEEGSALYVVPDDFFDP